MQSNNGVNKGVIEDSMRLVCIILLEWFVNTCFIGRIRYSLHYCKFNDKQILSISNHLDCFLVD